MRRALTPSRAELERLARSFCEKSLSMATRTTYASVVREYLAAIEADPLAATPDDVRRWSDRLITDGAPGDRRALSDIAAGGRIKRVADAVAE